MTTPDKASRERDALNRFIEECPDPTEEQILKWTVDYPDLADEIRELAEVSNLLALTRDGPGYEDVSEDEVDASLNSFMARQAQIELPRASATTLRMLIDTADKSLDAIASEIGLPATILSEMVAGQVKPLVSLHFFQDLAAALGVAVEVVQDGYANSVAQAREGRPRALSNAWSAPSWRMAVVTNRDMDAARKAYWLDGTH